MQHGASQLFRWALCPGSRKAEKGLKDIGSDDATEGTLLHAVMAGEHKATELSLSQLETIGRTMKLREQWLAGVFGERCADIEVHKEVELGLFDKKDPEKKLLVGHADYVAIARIADALHVAIVDYKYGWDPVEVAPSNLQLRAYAVMAAEKYGADDNDVYVYGATIQPRLSNDKAVHSVVYDLETLEKSREQILQIIEDSQAEDAMRLPSVDVCKYCKAKGTSRCPESSREVVKVVNEVTHGVTTLPSQKKDLDALLDRAEETLNEYSIPKLATLYEALILAEYIKKSVYARLLSLTKDGFETGYRISTPAPVRSIPRADRAFQKLIHNVGEERRQEFTEEFTKCCSVSIGEVESLCRHTFGWKGKEAKTQLAQLLGDCLELKERRGSLEKVA